MKPMEKFKSLKNKFKGKNKLIQPKQAFKVLKLQEFYILKNKLKKPNTILKFLLIVFIIFDVKYLLKSCVYLNLLNFSGVFKSFFDILNDFLLKNSESIVQFSHEFIVFLLIYYFLINILLSILINYICFVKFDYKRGIIISIFTVIVNISALSLGYTDISIWIMCTCSLAIVIICMYAYKMVGNIDLEDEANLDIDIKEDYIV